jgi:glycosyltransferase involved in cell wall biosynthesis
VRVLHVQHQHGIYDARELARRIEEAKRARVPVAVTEHTVMPGMFEWEREADTLVALTERGCEMLRGRLPGARVEHIPCGCPTWFPRRKAERGSVIGAFGFHEPHKGFLKLLDALRALPDTELLMFSQPRVPELEMRWAQASEGLRVRRITEFLPAHVVAEQLAAEADALVFWYDETPYGTASAAVRIGLATGVPVMTSPSEWFRDVRDVTHQPADLVGGIQRLLDDSELRERLSQNARAYCNDHSWPRIAERHLALWHALERN